MSRFLVCLDASPRASFVLSKAADLAARLDARLCLFRAVGIPSEVDQELLVHTAEGVLETLTNEARADLDAHAKRHPREVESVHVVVGTPWDAICREAKTLDVELVIIGSHGFAALDRVLGTTAAKVVNHCNRSVLVVRP